MPEPTLPRPSAVRPLRLADLGTPGLRLRDPADSEVRVTGITASSSQVRPGDLFAAVPGRSGHGARFVPAALESGAVAVLTDPAGEPDVPPSVPLVRTDDVRAVLGQVSSTVYEYPSHGMSLLGVTGTSGKTTTTYLVHAGLLAAGRTAGLIGTVGTLVGDRAVKTGFTTPEAPDLQALLAVMREQGVTDVAMEVSSHALAMGRVGCTRFEVGAFTNLSEDHLDFHPDMESYFAAKASLFAQTAHAVVVVDDQWGERMARQLARRTTVSTTGAEADWRASDVLARPDGSTTFHVEGPDGRSFDTGCAIPGRYNVANALLALVVLQRAGLDPEQLAPAVAAATVPGRMEPVGEGRPFLAVVDYSHKPAAVENALAALRPLTAGRLIIVLGCGGDRDRGKRPHMGQVAARDADVLVVTDDNPRSEDPAAIRAAMLAGVREVPEQQRAEVLEIGIRADAIRAAVELARPGDTVLVAGKGHETGQEIDGRVLPFDDRDQVRAALQAVAR